MMSYQSELQSVVTQAANDPKTSAGVSVATALLGGASVADLIQGSLSFLAILAGFVVTCLLGRVHLQQHRNDRLQNQILRQQLRELGGDPDKLEE
jgi:hypothetical protein